MSFTQKTASQLLPSAAIGNLVVTGTLISDGTRFPATPGTEGQVLAMGANDTLVFSDVAGEVLDAGQGIDITNTEGTEIISVDPTTACAIEGASSYLLAVGTQPLNLIKTAVSPGVAAANILSIGTNNLTLATNPSNIVAIGTANLTGPIGSFVSESIAIGTGNLEAMDLATTNIAIGSQCLQSLKSQGSDFNVAIGKGAGENLQGGYQNVCMGFLALGQAAGTDISQSNNNIAIGANTLASVTTSAGYVQGQIQDSAGANIAIGLQALNGVTTGVANVGVGFQPGTLITTGANNLCLGNQAGQTTVTGSNNVLVQGSAVTVYNSQGDPVAPAAVSDFIAIQTDTLPSGLLIGNQVAPLLEANTIGFGVMSSSLQLCPKELSYGTHPDVGTIGDFNVAFPSQTEIANIQNIGTGWLLGVDTVTPATISTPAIVNMTYLNPTVVNVQETEEFPLYMTVQVSVPDPSGLGGPAGNFNIENNLGEHSASVIFTRTGNVVQAYISGNTPAINWTISPDHHSAADGAISTENINYLALTSAAARDAPLTGQYLYDYTLQPEYGRAANLLTVGPVSDPANGVISELMAPALGSSYSQDFTVCPVRAMPDSGTTAGGHWLKFTANETYLGGCYAYSDLSGTGETGSNAKVRLTVSSFNTLINGNTTRVVGVSLSNVTHNYTTAANEGTDRNVVNFSELFNQLGTNQTTNPTQRATAQANTILRVQPQGIQVTWNDTNNSSSDYTLFYPENYEPNGFGTELIRFASGGGEPKIALTYMVIP